MAIRSDLVKTMRHEYTEVVSWQGQPTDAGACSLCGEAKDHELHTGPSRRVLLANQAFLQRALDAHRFKPVHYVRRGRIMPADARCAICGEMADAKVHDVQGVI